MGEAARNMDPFDEAYARTDWSRFEKLPLFDAANRINAYNTYLLMEHERPMKTLDRRRMLAALAAGALARRLARPARAAPADPGRAGALAARCGCSTAHAGAPAQAEGKAVVVVFWSTTCPFCRRHNAHVREAAPGRGRPAAAVLVTSRASAMPTAVRRYLARQGWQFAVTLDQAAMRARAVDAQA